MTEYADVPAAMLVELRSICLGLPETYEQQAWTGRRWCVRKRTFAHAYTVDSARGPFTGVTFRAAEPELDVLRHAGHPFYRPGWGSNVVGMVLGPDVDWTEVAELMTESYCVMAPQKLVAIVSRPAD